MQSDPADNLIREAMPACEHKRTPSIIESSRRHRPIIKQVIVAIISYGGAVGCGLTGGYSGVLLTQLRSNTSDILIDDDMASWIVSVYTGTTMVGCLLSGIIMNFIGRRSTAQVANALLVIGWVVIATAKSHLTLVIGRAIDGFGRGCSVPSGTFYLEEMADPRMRSSLCACLMLTYSTGIMIISVLVATFNWRIAAGVSAALTLLDLFGYCFLPESPVWLVRNEKFEKARDVFKWLWGKDHPDQAEKELQELIMRYKEETEDQSTKSGLRLKDYIKPQYLKPFFISHIANLLQIVCGTHLFIFYTSEIISGLNQSGNINVNFTIVFTSVTRVMSTALTSILLVWFGRRSLSISSGIGSGLAALVVATSSSLNFFPAWFMFALLALYVAFNTFGFFVLIPIMVGETLPSKIRSLAGAYIYTANDIGLFIATKIFHLVLANIGIDGLFWIFGCSSLFCSLFLYLLLPETKGRTLVEIEKYFSQKNIFWIADNKNDIV